jgi:putative aldouronate transport system permease protein
MRFWMEKPGLFSKWGLRLGMGLLAVIMLFPFIYVVAVSFSSYPDVLDGKLIVLPLHPNLDAYRYVLQGSLLLQSLKNSLFLVTVGTAINLAMTATMAYALSRRNVPGINVVLGMVLFTFLITPSIITKYLVVRELHLIDSLWALILPNAIVPFNLIVMRQFFMGIPEELIESAKLDGANDLQIFWKLVLPLSRATLAAIGLFYAVASWGNFFEASIYLNDPTKYPVAVILQLLVLQGSVPIDETVAGQTPPPPVTVQMAVVVLATIPILLIYPFVQRYFTKGVLTGSIKG